MLFDDILTIFNDILTIFNHILAMTFLFVLVFLNANYLGRDQLSLWTTNG